MAQWLNLQQSNRFINLTQLYILYEKSGAIDIGDLRLWQAGCQTNAGEFQKVYKPLFSHMISHLSLLFSASVLNNAWCVFFETFITKSKLLTLYSGYSLIFCFMCIRCLYVLCVGLWSKNCVCKQKTCNKFMMQFPWYVQFVVLY